MPIQICPGCKKNLQVSDKYIGKRVRCPRPDCTVIFAVTASAPSPLETPVAEPPGEITAPSDARVFISHAVSDQHFVDTAVQQFFKSHNIPTWYCPQDIQGGALFQQQIMEGLNKTDWFVVVLSKQSIKSPAVRQEVELAFGTKRGRILPILMEPLHASQINELHPELAAIQYEDFTKNVDRSQRHLLVSMVRQLNKERNGLEQLVGRQSLTIEDLKTEHADLNSRQRELERMVRRAATFDGQWSEGGGGGTIPVFCPLKTRCLPIVAVCNLKGGAGKTTLTANLGATLWGDPFRKRVLLIDLDYQASLSTICLDGKVRNKLRQQQRFAQEVFKQSQPDGKLIIQLAHEVSDERTKHHQASIIAADEDLARAEGEVLGRWMMQDDGVDGRYLLRQALHTNVVQKNFDIVLMDCPPRMTAAGINAFVAADFVLIPTPLEEVSTEAVPRLLRWVRERREKLLSNLDVLGVVVSRTKQTAKLLEYEKELLDRLKHDCKDAWGSAVKIFHTCVPTFPADSLGHQFPAQHSKLRTLFSELVKEMMPTLTVKSTIAAKPSMPALAKK